MLTAMKRHVAGSDALVAVSFESVESDLNPEVMYYRPEEKFRRMSVR